MNIEEFKEWLESKKACNPAMSWLLELNPTTIREAYEQCPRGDWLLWLAESAGVAPNKLERVKYHAVMRSMMYASEALESAGLHNESVSLSWCFIVDEYTARSAARSAAESVAWSAARSAARSAAWSAESAAWSAARSAAESVAWSAAWSAAESVEYQRCADDFREFVGFDILMEAM